MAISTGSEQHDQVVIRIAGAEPWTAAQHVGNANAALCGGWLDMKRISSWQCTASSRRRTRRRHSSSLATYAVSSSDLTIRPTVLVRRGSGAADRECQACTESCRQIAYLTSHRASTMMMWKGSQAEEESRSERPFHYYHTTGPWHGPVLSTNRQHTSPRPSRCGVNSAASGVEGGVLATGRTACCMEISTIPPAISWPCTSHGLVVQSNSDDPGPVCKGSGIVCE